MSLGGPPLKQLFSKTMRKNIKAGRTSCCGMEVTEEHLINYYFCMSVGALLHNCCRSFSGFTSSNSISGLEPQTEDGRCHLWLESLKS